MFRKAKIIRNKFTAIGCSDSTFSIYITLSKNSPKSLFVVFIMPIYARTCLTSCSESGVFLRKTCFFLRHLSNCSLSL